MLRNAFAGKIVGGFMGFVFGLPFAYLFALRSSDCTCYVG